MTHISDVVNQRILARTNNANRVLEWFSMKDIIGLQVVRSMFYVVTIRIPSKDITYIFDIMTFDCRKSKTLGEWELDYLIPENEFAKYIAPRIAELLEEEGL